MVEGADVFLENFTPGVAGRLGLGYQELQSINPRLVYCSISGYGQDGPYRDRKAFDLLIQGEAGLIATTGYPDRPAKVGPPVADMAAGMYAALGIVMALHQRERTGRGQLIDISNVRLAFVLAGVLPSPLLASGRAAHPRRHAPPLHDPHMAHSWQVTENW